MGWEQSIFPLLIVVGGEPNTGLFVYSGAPGPGNPPQFAVVAPGVTTDPYGNAITSSAVLVQGNIITETGGIFRTAAVAPLIQLDGPHDALFLYNAAAALVASDAGAAGNDGIGDAFLAGRTAYSAAGATRLAVQLGAGSGISQAVNFYTSSGPGGPWTLMNSVGLDGSGSGSSVIITGGALALPGGAAPGTSTSPQIFGDSSGFLAAIPGSGSSDTTVYKVGEAVYFTTASQNITSTTPAVITGLTQKVDAGSYYFRGIFIATQGGTNVNQDLGFSGPATSYCEWFYSVGGVGATSTSQKVNVSSLTTVAVGFSATLAAQYMEFEGTVTFSASGTFSCVAAEGTATDAFVVDPGCIFLVRPVQ